MARKSTKPKLDADGFLRTGIYQRYDGKPKPEHQLTFDKAKEMADAINSPVTQDLDRVRVGLVEIILPHVEGPLTTHELHEPLGRTCHSLIIGDTPQWYRERPELSKQDQCEIDRFRDAVAAMQEIRLIGIHLGPDGDIRFLVRAAYQLGRLCERIGVRPFESMVKAEIGRRNGARMAAIVTNEAHAELRPQYQSDIDRLMADGSSYTAACQQVATSLGVSERTVRNHTINPSPRNKGRLSR